MPSTPAAPHVWKFFRTGGIDQVALETGADLLALATLDQELWVALSCPVKGLELDERTLAVIDTDGDGRIGVPEVIAAVNWAAARLNDAGDLLKGADSLPLAAINAATPEGRVLLGAVKRILAGEGLKDAAEITVAQAADTAKVVASSPLNGDGIIPAEATDDPAVRALIGDIIASVGQVARGSSFTGVTASKIEAFFAEVAAYVAWSEQKTSQSIAVLGDATDGAFAAIKAVRAKVDDYFARTRLAAFDPRATAALNRGEAEYVAIASRELKLSSDELAGFPLARVEPDRPLPLSEGLNPAWAAAMAALRELAVVPVLGADKASLTAAEWAGLTAKFAAFEAGLEANAGRAVEKLGLARMKEILAGPGRAALDALVAQDKAGESILRELVEYAQGQLSDEGIRGEIYLFKNNTDSTGNSYGCHENYCIERIDGRTRCSRTRSNASWISLRSSGNLAACMSSTRCTVSAYTSRRPRSGRNRAYFETWMYSLMAFGSGLRPRIARASARFCR